MARKKNPRQWLPKEEPEPFFDRDLRGLERAMANVHRLLADRDLESLDQVNAFLAHAVDQGQFVEPTTDREIAQEIMYDAFDAKGKRRAALARKALAKYPDCADAYTLLAEETAKNLEEAIDLFAKGMEAGKRSLPEDAFTEGVGEFWHVLETRPYMRARAGLGAALWLSGNLDAAIGHYQDMLRLNPDDNQGLRYPLVGWLLQARRDREAQSLLNRYGDDRSAFMAYAKSIMRYRKYGRGPKAYKSLVQAAESNSYVVPLLGLGLGDHPPCFVPYGVGDVSEALVILQQLYGAMEQTLGYVDWVAGEAKNIVTDEDLANLRAELTCEDWSEPESVPESGGWVRTKAARPGANAKRRIPPEDPGQGTLDL